MKNRTAMAVSYGTRIHDQYIQPCQQSHAGIEILSSRVQSQKTTLLNTKRHSPVNQERVNYEHQES